MCAAGGPQLLMITTLCCFLTLQAGCPGSAIKDSQASRSPSKAGKKLLAMLNLRKAAEQALIGAIGSVPARLRHIPIQVRWPGLFVLGALLFCYKQVCL